MAKGVFLNVSAPGHVIPTLGLVAELVARGDEIAYFEMPAFRGEIEAFGATFRPYPEIGRYVGPAGANQYYLAPVLTWHAREWVPRLLGPVAAERPDYIVHDSLCLWGRVVARQLGVPAVCSIATAAFCPRSFHGCPRLKTRRRTLITEAREGLRCFRDWRRDLVAANEVGPLPLIDTFTNPEPVNICYLPRELQPYSETFGDDYHFVGPCAPTRGRQIAFDFSRLGGRPLVYVSFGTFHDPGPDVFRACLAALEGEDVQGVVVLSPTVDLSALGPVPPNVLVIAAGEAPQLALLERAAAFVTHGGGGGLREAAWHGVPMIAIPQTYEQEILSAQMAAQGAGLMLEPSEVTADSLRAALRRVLSIPEYRRQGARLAAACRAAGGASRAADAIRHAVKEFRR